MILRQIWGFSANSTLISGDIYTLEDAKLLKITKDGSWLQGGLGNPHLIRQLINTLKRAKHCQPPHLKPVSLFRTVCTFIGRRKG